MELRLILVFSVDFYKKPGQHWCFLLIFTGSQANIGVFLRCFQEARLILRYYVEVCMQEARPILLFSDDIYSKPCKYCGFLRIFK